MQLDRLLLLLLFIWIIWRIFTRKRTKEAKRAMPSPSGREYDLEIVEPPVVAAPFPAQPAEETVMQHKKKQILAQPRIRPAGRRLGKRYPDQHFLQQAVIWSEILALPVGLRDDW